MKVIKLMYFRRIKGCRYCAVRLYSTSCPVAKWSYWLRLILYVVILLRYLHKWRLDKVFNPFFEFPLKLVSRLSWWFTSISSISEPLNSIIFTLSHINEGFFINFYQTLSIITVCMLNMQHLKKRLLLL